jgi:GNAT superfamily N-acetyltransferase
MNGFEGSDHTTLVRRYRPEDRPAVIHIIKAIYDDYNYTMDFEEFDRDLVDIDTAYRDSGGEFWVVDDGGTVAGAIGVMPLDEETCELRRLYVGKGRWGRGFGSTLIATVISWARDRGYPRIVLWSDVLFENAHHLYVKHGFEATQETRAIDPMNPTSVERFFTLRIRPR